MAVLGSAGFGLFWYLRLRRPEKPPYQFAAVSRGSISAKVTATGTLSALVTVQVGSQVSGRIAQLKVDFNSPVRKGQLIAEIDPQLFDAAKAQARANDIAAQGSLAKAKAQQRDAERQYQRAKSLAERKLIAQADLDTALANLEAAVAQVQSAQGSLEQAKASYHQAEVNLNYTHILSPINGVVISRSVDMGQTVAASFQSPTLFVIAEDLRKMQVDTSVAEADIGKLKDGMETSFTVDAYPAEIFRGKIRQIRNAAQTVQSVVTYDAVIDVENPDLKLKPGMTANVTFVYAQKDDVLRIPNAALRFHPASSKGPDEVKPRRVTEHTPQRTAWILHGQELAPVAVQTGISDGLLTEMIPAAENPLAEGEPVVVEATGAASPSKPPAGGGSPRRMF